MKTKTKHNLNSYNFQGEIDEPLNSENNAKETLLNSSVATELESLTKAAKSISDIKIKDKAFHLIIISLISLGVLFIGDTTLNIIGLPISAWVSNLFELFKQVVTLCLGYLLAIDTKNN